MVQLFIAINLRDFHSNQKKSSTRCDMKFIGAKTMERAKKHLERWDPGTAWAVVSKRIFDKNIVHASLDPPGQQTSSA